MLLRNRFSSLRLSAAAITVAALGGCASNAIEGVNLDELAPEASKSALYEAKERFTMECTSVAGLTAQTPLSDVVFTCWELEVTATLGEIRDAGWRLISLNVGAEERHEDDIQMPLRIQVIKLF